MEGHLSPLRPVFDLPSSIFALWVRTRRARQCIGLCGAVSAHQTEPRFHYPVNVRHLVWYQLAELSQQSGLTDPTQVLHRITASRVRLSC
ncbi:MAG: hypothetical protein FJ280_10605 [Planctomycetes bacterium]|nr:hypothetical protein [Planctomycetota bacterium]